MNGRYVIDYTSASPSPQIQSRQPPLAFENDKYLSELLLERQKLSPFLQVLPICSRLLNQEISRISSLLNYSYFDGPDSLDAAASHLLGSVFPSSSPLNSSSSVNSVSSPPVEMNPNAFSGISAAAWSPLQNERLPLPPMLVPAPGSQSPVSCNMSWSSPMPGSCTFPLSSINTPLSTPISGPPNSTPMGTPMGTPVVTPMASLLSPGPVPPSAPISSTPPVRSPPIERCQVIKKTRRLEIPTEKYPNFNFVGRILGPRGNSLKRVEAQTGCRVLIRGRGSIKDAAKEDKMRDKPGFEHLNENLHVLVEAELPASVIDSHLSHACEIIEDLLRPVDERCDVIKRAQLRELAVLNGTLREDGRRFPHGPNVNQATPGSAVAVTGSINCVSQIQNTTPTRAGGVLSDRVVISPSPSPYAVSAGHSPSHSASSYQQMSTSSGESGRLQLGVSPNAVNSSQYLPMRSLSRQSFEQQQTHSSNSSTSSEQSLNSASNHINFGVVNSYGRESVLSENNNSRSIIAAGQTGSIGGNVGGSVGGGVLGGGGSAAGNFENLSSVESADGFHSPVSSGKVKESVSPLIGSALLGNELREIRTFVGATSPFNDTLMKRAKTRR